MFSRGRPCHGHRGKIRQLTGEAVDDPEQGAVYLWAALGSDDTSTDDAAAGFAYLAQGLRDLHVIRMYIEREARGTHPR
jgi:hypothetical protein